MLGIGDFARYAGVSVRMLRHYDAIGLLSPSYVDPASGYRHYDESLLDRAHTLVALKELGFTLEDVGRMLDRAVGREELAALLAERQTELRAQIVADQARLGEVERRLRLLEGEIMELEYAEKALPTLTLTQLRDHVDEQSEIGAKIGPMFEQLVQKTIEAGRRPAHPGYAWYTEDGDGMTIAAGFETEPLPGTEQGSVPGCERAVVATYRGPMEHIGEAWQELAAHVSRSGHRLSGPAREVYLQTQGPQETWVTELQQPIS